MANYNGDLNAPRKPLKGHKLLRSWSGVEGGYANGRCECGNWRYGGWTHSMRRVIESHTTHLNKMRVARTN